MHGRVRPVLEDNMDISTYEGKCMVAFIFSKKYFIKASWTNSLEVVMSGSVIMRSRPDSALSSGVLHPEGIRMAFQVSIDLMSEAIPSTEPVRVAEQPTETEPVRVEEDKDKDEEEEDAAPSVYIYGVAFGAIALVAMLICVYGVAVMVSYSVRLRSVKCSYEDMEHGS